MTFEVFIGYDPRERDAWKVACASLQNKASRPVAVRPIWRQQLELLGLYTRPHERRCGVLWDVISGTPCSTEFSVARFGVPLLAQAHAALFVDVDFLFRGDVWELAEAFDPKYAAQVVKHLHKPAETEKMDGQVQRVYARKNWSSCVLWNTRHEANRLGAQERLNTWHRDALHGFHWLDPHEIGDLPDGDRWNWLEGHSTTPDPKAVHYTRGTPDMKGYGGSAYAAEWFTYRDACARL